MPSKNVVATTNGVEALTETLLAVAVAKLDAEVPIVPEVPVDNIPKRYIANLYWELEPQAKDVFCGSYVFWESTNTINWEALNPKYSTDLELLSESDILVTKEGRSYLVSRWETPKEWLLNLPFAALGNRYICKNVVELYETE
jgi:hypothetical protein|tara:strand:+ start:295 stop:723 length:429 start_codon:yes stop_codon:yes gene_type:complete